MNFNLPKRARFAALSAALFSLFAAVAVPAVNAQEEGVPQVVDEVIAQVNTEVITLSMLKKEMANAVEGLKQQNKLSDQQAQAEVEKRRNEIIATLVNEQVILQKGKELGMAEEVEKEVNKRMLEVAKEQGITTIEELERAMRASGVEPSEVRQTLRNEITKQWVLGGEVDRRIYLGLTEAEIKTYYEANKDKFRKPETVTISEIFLSTVGRDEAEVKVRAEKLVAQVRGGADFGALAAVQSEREQNNTRVAPQTKGKLGTVALTQFRDETVLNAVKPLKAGGVTDPIKDEYGFTIFRVDERTAGGDSSYDENKVREAITLSRLDKEREEYIRKLRQEAYIEVAPGYREAVLPLLNLNAQAASSDAAAQKKEDKKAKENKKP
ncbi:MAG: peptidyl-prolyl cis-trans isomerase [Pyrinomonadaceae bacterium]